MDKMTWDFVAERVSKLPDLQSQAEEAVLVVGGSLQGLQIIRDRLVERGGSTAEAWSRFSPAAVKAFTRKLASGQLQ
jgi:hypothetical protein